MRRSIINRFVTPIARWFCVLGVVLTGCGEYPSYEMSPPDVALASDTLSRREKGSEGPSAVKPTAADVIFGAQQAELSAGDGAADDHFGTAIAMSGDTAIFGAPDADVGSNNQQGAAYVFVRMGAGWFQQAKLTASDGAAEDRFGLEVAISGDSVVVGARGDDIDNNADQGSAYVFTRSGTTWTQQAKLVANDGASYDYFGDSIALSEDTAIVGATFADVGGDPEQGTAYVFTRSGATWTQQTKLEANDASAHDRFGSSATISGDTAIIGAANKASQGAAYVFTRNGDQWTQQATLTASDGAMGDRFGDSVALEGDNAIVGAMYKKIGLNSYQGSAYVFTRSGTTWTQESQLIASDGDGADTFGCSVAISGDTAIVGAVGAEVGNSLNQGTAYVFTRAIGYWWKQAQLSGSDSGAGDQFGSALALSGNTVIVGATHHNVGNSIDQGSAYVLLRGALGDSCTAATECTSGFCADGVCCNSACQGTCQACSTAIKHQGKDGECGFIAMGEEPRLATDCPASPAASCGLNGHCDGNGSCQSWSTCGSICNGNVLVQDTCQGIGVCGPSQTTTDCAPFLCQNNECLTSCTTNAQCTPDAYCDPAGLCQPQLPVGTACGASSMTCLSGNCIDGFCCDTSCTGTCRACSTTKTGQPDGTCAPIAPQTDPDNECTGNLSCDGVGSCKQAMGASCVSHAECAIGYCVDGVCCNSACGGDSLNDCQACSIAAGAMVDGVCTARSANSVCRAAAGACDAAEICDGVSVECSSDSKRSMGTECRPKAGECDIVETCDGVASDCPNDMKSPAGTECRAKVGVCDAAEICDGIAADCPSDSKEPAGTECRANAGECDVPETCNGTSNICPPDDWAVNGAVCSQGVCLDGSCISLIDAGAGSGGHDNTPAAVSPTEQSACSYGTNGPCSDSGYVSVVVVGLVMRLMRRRTKSSTTFKAN